MKPRLVILSDLWGIKKSEWLSEYVKLLAHKFEIKCYDSPDLGKIDKAKYLENDLHHQFVNGGIEAAAKNLLELETKNIDVLAFSIGGVIAWKAALSGLKINHLYAISSTRLRYENEEPNCTIHLYFGDKDNYKPTSDWFDTLDLKPKIFKNKEHSLYVDIDCIKEICKDIVVSYDA